MIKRITKMFKNAIVSYHKIMVLGKNGEEVTLTAAQTAMTLLLSYQRTLLEYICVNHQPGVFPADFDNAAKMLKEGLEQARRDEMPDFPEARTNLVVDEAVKALDASFKGFEYPDTSHQWGRMSIHEEQARAMFIALIMQTESHTLLPLLRHAVSPGVNETERKKAYDEAAQLVFIAALPFFPNNSFSGHRMAWSKHVLDTMLDMERNEATPH